MFYIWTFILRFGLYRIPSYLNTVEVGVKHQSIDHIQGPVFDRFHYVCFVCNTVKYINQSDNFSQGVLRFNISGFGRLVTDWSVENIIPDMTPYGMLLIVSALPKKNSNKCIIYYQIVFLF
jgi:hypothetical protein